MNIRDQVMNDVLSENFISQELQIHLDKAIVNNLKSQLLKSLINEDALVLKYNKVSEYMIKSSITLDDMKINVPKRKVALGNSVIQVVKIILNVLDTTWLIIKEFQVKMEKEKRTHLDVYYTRIVDALLLKVKILHLSVLITTYDDAPFIQALKSLSQLLKSKSTEAEKKLEEINQQLKEYNDIGPEFETLKEAYKSLIYKIQVTKDDINRIQNN